VTRSTLRREIEIGRRYSPEVAWPTLLLLVGVYLGLGLASYFALAGHIPWWLGAVLNGVILYGTYTIVHEGVHENIVSRKSRFRWINMSAAFFASLPLCLLIYPHRASHFLHHRQCNTQDDPDIYARGSFGVVTFWRIPLAILQQLNPLAQARQCRELALSRWQQGFSYVTYLLLAGLVLGLVAAGYAFELMALWFIPFFIGYGLMLVLFTWVPHHPHILTGRYHDTRCSLWPGGNLLTQGQNYHLIHHMMPWVPWYNYERVFREIRPWLEQNHALIDGFCPRAAAKAVTHTRG